MDPRTKKNLEEFKKQIKKEQIEKKKLEIRKGLPYYEDFFINKEDDSNSNGTNSRSSRFPVPLVGSKGGKGRIMRSDQRENFAEQDNDKWNADEVNANEKERQYMYLQYLKCLTETLYEEKIEALHFQLSKRYGNDCFHSVSQLHDRIYLDLIDFQQATLNDQPCSQNFCQQPDLQIDWAFILAAFYFSKNKRFPEIERTTFALITNYFNEWSEIYLKEIISKGPTIEELKNRIQELNEMQKRMDEIVVASFMDVLNGQGGKEQNQVECLEVIQSVVKYFSSKIKTFLTLEKDLFRHYSLQQMESFSQIIFNYRSVYVIENLVSILTSNLLNNDTIMDILTLVNSYYSEYPVNVESETQTSTKFNSFLAQYLRKLHMFLKHMKKNIIPLQQKQRSQEITEKQFLFMDSTMKLLHSVYWRESLNHEVLKGLIIVFESMVDLTLSINLMVFKIVQLAQFHSRILNFYLVSHGCINDSSHQAQDNSKKIGFDGFWQYLNILVIEWHSFKFNYRNNSSSIVQQFSVQTSQNLLNFQFYLIYSLYLTKLFLQTAQTQENTTQIQEMLTYVDLVYSKERTVIMNFKKEDYIKVVNLLIFQPIVQLYFEVFSQNEESQCMNNPENLSKNNGDMQRDIEI